MLKNAKLLLYFLELLVLQYLYILLLVFLNTVLRLQLSLTTTALVTPLKQAAYHPINEMLSFIRAGNQIYIIGALAITVYIAVLAFQKYHKDNKKWEQSSKGTHGTAKWGTLKELVHDGNFKAVKESQFFAEWQKTLEKGTDK